MTEDTIENKSEHIEPEKKTSNKEMIKKLKKQNPGVKVKPLPGGGFTIVNPRTPSPLLKNLIKRIEKE